MRGLLFSLSLLLALPTLAAELSITTNIPRLNVAEYHRPYVAFWLEQDGQHRLDLAVWYDLNMKDNEGNTWLKDMRQWWRKSGRSLDMPVDGLSGATRAPGEHRQKFTVEENALGDLPAGDYQLVVEASREVGGREMVKVPFQWPPSQAQVHTANGSTELGEIRLHLQP